MTSYYVCTKEILAIERDTLLRSTMSEEWKRRGRQRIGYIYLYNNQYNLGIIEKRSVTYFVYISRHLKEWRRVLCQFCSSVLRPGFEKRLMET